MKNIYFICPHVSELVLYHEVSLFFNKFFPGIEQHLILIEYPPFAHIPHDGLLNHYDSVNELPQCECAFSNRWHYELLPWVVLKRVLKAITFIRKAKKLKFQDDSICILNEMSETSLTTRLLINKFKSETIHSVVCRIGTCYHRSSNCNTNSWLSWLLHNVYVLIGAYPVSVHFYGWMVAERRYYREHRIIDHFLVFSNRFYKDDDYTEVKYPLIKNVQSKNQEKQYVFFIDNGLAWPSLIPNISKEQWITTMNQILQALTDLYKNENVILLMKLHPGSKAEVPYKLSGFDIYDEDDTAEMVYSSCRENIRAVYSVASTSARNTSLYGIDCYVFYEMFEFPDEIMDRHKKYLLDFSNVISIRSLDMLHVPEQKDYSSPSSSDDLEGLAQVFRDIEGDIVDK